MPRPPTGAAVHNLVRRAADSCPIDQLLERISIQLDFGDRFRRNTTNRLEGEEVVMSWLSLRVQLWLRELKPMVASVEAETHPAIERCRL